MEFKSVQKFISFLVRHNVYLLLLLYCSIALLAVRFERDNLASRISGSAKEIEASINERIMSYGYLLNLRKENERLMRLNTELLSQSLRNERLLSDAKARSALLADSSFDTAGYVVARVIDRKFSARENMLMINAGKNQGIRPDMAVLTPKGLVGRVVSVTERYAAIMPLIHTDFKVSVISSESNAMGILAWNGGAEHLASIEHVPISSPLKQGEEILTTDFSTFSPGGIPVGRVVRIRPDKLFYTIDIRLAVDFSTLSYVLVAPAKKDQEKLDLLDSVMSQGEPATINPVN